MKCSLYSVLLALMFLVLNACTSSQVDEQGNPFEGNWQAQWDTNPAGFPDVSDASIFSMNGNFNFENERVTVTANGFPGCIFSADTLSHTLNWQYENDTLSLINDGDIYGMTYKVLGIEQKQIRLQLMEDIFVTLKR